MAGKQGEWRKLQPYGKQNLGGKRKVPHIIQVFVSQTYNSKSSKSFMNRNNKLFLQTKIIGWKLEKTVPVIKYNELH